MQARATLDRSQIDNAPANRSRPAVPWSRILTAAASIALYVGSVNRCSMIGASWSCQTSLSPSVPSSASPKSVSGIRATSERSAIALA